MNCIIIYVIHATVIYNNAISVLILITTTGITITCYVKNKIIDYIKLEVYNKSDNDNYPNFQLIAIKALDEHYTKILESRKLYYFNNNFKIEGNRVKFINE